MANNKKHKLRNFSSANWYELANSKHAKMSIYHATQGQTLLNRIRQRGQREGDGAGQKVDGVVGLEGGALVVPGVGLLPVNVQSKLF